MKNYLNKILKKQNINWLILFIIPFLYGLSLEFSIFLTTIIFLVKILIIYLRNKKIKIKINNALICSAIILFFSCLSLISGIDKTDCKIGILKCFSICIFNIVIMQFSQNRKQSVIKAIPYSVLTILTVSLILSVIPNLKYIVISESGRLIGFFNYANTFSLYILIGIIIYNEKCKNRFATIINSIFLIGIILTGSRTTLILTALYAIYYVILNKNKRNEKKSKIELIIFIALALIVFIIIAKTSNIIDRFSAISINSGTFLERIIYWKDGLKLLKNNIFGYGYMGYFYKIPEIQTGNYISKFVHNEYLQIALDIGIIPMIIFVVFLIQMIFSKENEKVNKIILIVIMLHIFMDFDLQFMLITYILFLCFDNKTYKEWNIEINLTFLISIAICIVLYSYYFLATFMNFIQKYEYAKRLINNYTETNVTILSYEEDVKKAYKLSEEIESENKYIPLVYKIKSIYYLQNGDIDKMSQNKKRQIELNKYDANIYDEYILMLSTMLEKSVKDNDNKTLNKALDYVIEIEKIVEENNSKLDKLEFKIYQNPEIKLNEKSMEYIEKIKSLKMEETKSE